MQKIYFGFVMGFYHKEILNFYFLGLDKELLIHSIRVKFEFKICDVFKVEFFQIILIAD